jgi:hypothetical protein
VSPLHWLEMGPLGDLVWCSLLLSRDAWTTSEIPYHDWEQRSILFLLASTLPQFRLITYHLPESHGFIRVIDIHIMLSVSVDVFALAEIETLTRCWAPGSRVRLDTLRELGNQ